MKRTKIISALIIIATLLCALTSCGGGNVDNKGTATILVDNGGGDYTSYVVDLSKLKERENGAVSLLEYLSGEKGTDLRYETESGAYGAYIKSINATIFFSIISANPFIIIIKYFFYILFVYNYLK